MRLFFFTACLLGSQFIYGQNFTQFWFKTSLHYHIDSKLSTTLELHHRTQSILSAESPFRYPLNNAARLWLIYKLSNRETTNFSPYAFISNYSQMKKEEDVMHSNANEHRIHLQYENKMPVSSAWSMTSRFSAEYRIFERNQDLFRFRIREGLIYIVSKNLSLQLYDELFLNTINIERSHVFDQNRIGFQLSYNLDRHIKLDLGHNLIHALPRNGELVPTSFIFLTTFYYTI